MGNNFRAFIIFEQDIAEETCTILGLGKTKTPGVYRYQPESRKEDDAHDFIHNLRPAYVEPTNSYLAWTNGDNLSGHIYMDRSRTVEILPYCDYPYPVEQTLPTKHRSKLSDFKHQIHKLKERKVLPQSILNKLIQMWSPGGS